MNRDFSDKFLIYSTEFERDIETIDIIGRHVREFGEMLYHWRYKLITLQESNLNFSVYLATFQDNCDLNEAVDYINNLVERKREEEEQNFYVSPNRLIPEVKLLTQNINEFKVCSSTTYEHEQQISGEIQELKEMIKTIKNETDVLSKKRLLEGEKKKENERIQQESIKLMEEQKEWDLICNNVRKLKLINTDKVERFENQTWLKVIRNDRKILEDICTYMSTHIDSDPFEDIPSTDTKIKSLVNYFKILQGDLRSYKSETTQQRKIHEWFKSFSRKYVFFPTEKRKRHLILEFKQKWELKDTIGTVHCLELKYEDKDLFCFMAICDRKIFCCAYGVSAEDALANLNIKMKQFKKFSVIRKFATEMIVEDKYSKHFVHSSNEEVYEENEKVINWMKNNFYCLKFSMNEDFFTSVPAVYTISMYSFEKYLYSQFS